MMGLGEMVISYFRMEVIILERWKMGLSTVRERTLGMTVLSMLDPFIEATFPGRESCPTPAGNLMMDGGGKVFSAAAVFLSGLMETDMRAFSKIIYAAE